METSISWPTPVTIGMAEEAIARARTSSLNSQRSSREPPPRARRMTSNSAAPVDIGDGSGDFLGGAVALDRDVKESYSQPGEPIQHLEDILKGSRLTAGYDGDVHRIGGQILLSLGGEEPFGFELGAELLEGELQRALAERLELADVELILSALGIDLHAAGREQFDPIHRVEAQRGEIIAEHDAIDAGLGVLEREVEVAGFAVRAAVAAFAADHDDEGQAAANDAIDLAGELGDGPGFPAGACTSFFPVIFSRNSKKLDRDPSVVQPPRGARSGLQGLDHQAGNPSSACSYGTSCL